jgi:hypothetical protein
MRQEHKVYKGQAYIRDEQNQWRSCGWARIMVLRDGASPLFEGAFVKDGNVHHVKVLSKYNSQKLVDDLEFINQSPDNTMVGYRDSDRFVKQTGLLGRSVDGVASQEETNASMCAHDRLKFNMQGTEKSWGAMDLMGRLVRRQDISGNTGGSREQLAQTIGSTVGCPTTRRVALVAAAADCTYIQTNGNSTGTRSNIISIFNQVKSYHIGKC